MTFDSSAATAIDHNSIREHVIKELQSSGSVSEIPSDRRSLFQRKSVNTWIEDAKRRPMPKRLFSDLWIEDELSILFADTGKGKSVLAMQIGDQISRGESESIFATETAPQTVLYFDFELSDKQLEARYSMKGATHFERQHVFSKLFQRLEIDAEALAVLEGTNFDQLLTDEIEAQIQTTHAKVIIIDNITYLRSATETAKDALPLMKGLIRMKKQYGLSILVLAHTPKRDLSRPLTINDLQGSKMLSNFADSVFAIGESAKDSSVRYLKQLKCRSVEVRYDAENVATCQIVKPDNFLRLEFLSFGREREHLNTPTEASKDELLQKVQTLAKQGFTQRDIARDTGLAVGTVNKYLKKLVHGVNMEQEP